jgi:large subunit ribosomal protein L10
MPNIINRMVTAELADLLGDAEGLLFFNFSSLTMVQNEAVRIALAERGVSVRMVRNSLVRRLLAEKGVELDADAFKGNTAMVAALKAAYFEGQVMGAAEAAALADLPDRDTVNAMLLGVISGPARGLATILNAVPSSVARVIQAKADKEGGAE